MLLNFFLKTVPICVAFAVAAAQFRAKPGERLKDSLKAGGATLAICLAGGLAAYLGVEIKGINAP